MLLSLIAFLQSPISADGNGSKNGPILRTQDRCQSLREIEDEVVVCGRRDLQSRYRIAPQPEKWSDDPNAEFSIADGVGVKLHAQQGEIGGIPTNRAMISLKMKF